MKTSNAHVRVLILAVFALTALVLAGAASAMPICEIDCASYTPCDQICRIQGTYQYATCAGYICDEPQFPWPPGAAAFTAVFGESELSPACDVAVETAAGAEAAKAAETQEDAADPSSSD